MTLCLAWLPLALAQLPHAKPVPELRATPLPGDQIAFEWHDREIARYHFAPTLNRPFLYPIIGPSGRPLTRMGHPGDPQGHSHHNSVWFSLAKVNGVDFWTDAQAKTGSRIIHSAIDQIEEQAGIAYVITRARWMPANGPAVLDERRVVIIRPLPNREWLLVQQLELSASAGKVTLPKAQFGPIGVRVAKTIGEHHGGGLLRNSEGASREAAIFRKPARWVDYSGPVANGVIEGLTLFDYPANPGFPSPFHVREDGWMGAMLSMSEDIVIEPGRPLRLRYGLYVHAGLPAPLAINAQWRAFANGQLLPNFGPPMTESDCRHGSHRRYTVPRVFRTQADCVAFVLDK